MYADVALPIAQGPFTFSLPSALANRVECGCVVGVTLGARRRVGGIVVEVHNRKPRFAKIKPIEEVLFDRPLISPESIRLWQWMADYYMCTLGEVVRAALPSLIKPAGLTDEEFSQRVFRPRTVEMLRPVEGVSLPARARAQVKALEILRELASKGEVGRNTLMAEGVSAATIRKLVDAGAVEVAPREICCATAPTSVLTPTLTEPQQQACDALREAFNNYDTALLQGVAGSGKTEIMMSLASQTLNKGRSVVWLVPEMALSKHFAERLRRTFGDCVTLYHSGLSDRQRAEIVWSMAHSDVPRLVVGVRTAVLLPTPNIGLVIVDEEYDPSYKQTDTAPRYSARDCAVMLASLHGAKTILSAATPSMESYANALAGKYAHVTVEERYDGEPAEVIISDTRRSARRGERHGFMNLELRQALDAVLSEGRQAILFQNRRGTASWLECECGRTPRCPRCNISLAVHGTRMVCHYCGRVYPLPESCPDCGSKELRPMGTGTQQIEQNIRDAYPTAEVARLDRDTASSPARMRHLLNDMESGRTQILIGTQLVTKGFDFGGVEVVGILNADNLFAGADFRASERALDTLMQAAGRAGRRTTRGKVIIQTAEPDNPLIMHASRGEFDAAAATILAERREFNYPPYCRLITIEVRSELYDEAAGAAQHLAKLIAIPEVEVLGPQLLHREGYGRGHTHIIMLKIGRTAPLTHIKQQLRTLADQTTRKWHHRVTISFNVDS
ncbi:MAG: primosomal protein N' [Rikenellaceae bacterium]|nr:primosomal protein N' [Rikenellaceae bacterium]